MKLYYRIYRFGIFGLLFILGLSCVLMPQTAYSENENRYLDSFPKLTAESILSGEFQESFESAFSDQFSARNTWMTGSSILKKLEGFREISDVYLGSDDYYITKVTQADIDQKQFMQNLRYAEYLGAADDAECSLLLVPSAGVLLENNLPKYAPYYNAGQMYSTADTILKKTKNIDVRTEMQEYAKQTQVYFRTDHHWTLSGAYAAYSTYCDVMELGKHTYGYFSAKKISETFLGTMHSKVLLPGMDGDTVYAATNVPQAKVVYDGEEKSTIYDVEKLTQKNKYEYFFGGNYAKVTITMNKKAKNKLLVIKDSFANSFVPFLMEDYDEITMIDLRYYNDSVQELLKENYSQILILYEMSNFAGEQNIYKLTL
ncbi:MAG: hypothetical protein LUH14_07200 [Clostridiaceae bacterium]|nr:hypothetical protein [Clostridiaceae bacterium]